MIKNIQKVSAPRESEAVTIFWREWNKMQMEEEQFWQQILLLRKAFLQQLLWQAQHFELAFNYGKVVNIQ